MNFDFTARYQSAFGFVSATVSSRLDSQGFGDVVKDSGLNMMAYANSEAAFDEVVLEADGKEYLFAYRSLSEQYSNIFATPPMLSMKRSKRLAVTVIDNSDVEVVERYATEPWEITWRGLLIDMENHQFPLDRLELLNAIFETDKVLGVSSDILRRIGVLGIYIKDISVDFVEGFEDTIGYTLTARAIKTLEYQLSNQ